MDLTLTPHRDPTALLDGNCITGQPCCLTFTPGPQGLRPQDVALQGPKGVETSSPACVPRDVCPEWLEHGSCKSRGCPFIHSLPGTKTPPLSQIPRPHLEYWTGRVRSLQAYSISRCSACILNLFQVLHLHPPEYASVWAGNAPVPQTQLQVAPYSYPSQYRPHPLASTFTMSNPAC